MPPKDYNFAGSCYNDPMQVVLVIFSLGLLGVIIYFAVSPKSSRLLKLAALAALVLIAISLVVSSIVLVIRGFEQSHEENTLPIFLDIPVQPTGRGNIAEIIVFMVFLLFLVILISVVGVREHRQRQEELKKASSARMFHHEDESSDLGVKDEEQAEKPEKPKGEFDLDLE